MWHIKPLNASVVHDLYTQRMIHDFPQAELPPQDTLTQLVRSGLAEAFILTDDTQDTAYAIVARGDGVILITHLAVFSELRGGGHGSRMLSLLSEKYQSEGTLVVEVDAPDAPVDDDERRIRERRIVFYERAGYALLPDVQYHFNGIDMRLMTYPGLPAADIQKLTNAMLPIYQTMVGVGWNVDVSISMP